MKRAGIGDRLGQNYDNMELDFRGSYNKARSPLPLCTLYKRTLLRTYRPLTKAGMAAHGGGWERAKSLGHKLESGIEKSTLEQLAWFIADEADAAELFARIPSTQMLQLHQRISDEAKAVDVSHGPVCCLDGPCSIRAGTGA